jgi:glucose-6-phosphate dehydrogenase assembly protein OpcA
MIAMAENANTNTNTNTTDAFLSGEGVPVDLHDIETELIRLWGPAAERAGGPVPEQPNVTRIVLANLVVIGQSTDLARFRETLDTVTTRFPCRTIVVCRSNEPGRAIAAEVSALCHLPAPGLPQACSERIVLRTGADAAPLVPGAIRPLLESDLPFVLWWTEDPRIDEALYRALGDECSRLILDLPDPGADPTAIRFGLDLTISPYSRDTAWFGLTRWRELIAQFFDAPDHLETLSRIDSVRIVAETPEAVVTAPRRIALWLAAWLAGQLFWRPQGQPERSGGSVRATFKGPDGPVAVTIETLSDPGLATGQFREITLTTRADAGAGGSTFKLERVSSRSAEVRIEIDAPDYCTLPRTVLAPIIDPARRVAAALESARNDPPFQNALPHFLWLLGD